MNQMIALRKATLNDVSVIWEIIQQAIEQRKADGSDQWQNGYPNQDTLLEDIEKDWGFVLTENEQVIAYAAIIFEREPAYEQIEGSWLTNDDYVVVHRVATANLVKGRGMASYLFKLIEELALANGTASIKVDTNFDNVPMLKILERLGYSYCGEVVFQGNRRKAFEKVLVQSSTM